MNLPSDSSSTSMVMGYSYHGLELNASRFWHVLDVSTICSSLRRSPPIRRPETDRVAEWLHGRPKGNLIQGGAWQGERHFVCVRKSHFGFDAFQNCLSRRTSAVRRGARCFHEARELARCLLRRLRDRLPKTEEAALITVASNALFGSVGS